MLSAIMISQHTNGTGGISMDIANHISSILGECWLTLLKISKVSVVKQGARYRILMKFKAYVRLVNH